MPSLGQFIAARRSAWAELEALLARGEGNGLRSLTAEELDALGRRYRQVVSDLAIARRDFPDDQVTDALNQLAARAHMRVYRAPGGSWARIARFLTIGFALRFRAAGGYVVLAAALFFIPAIWAFLAALVDAELRDVLVPERLREIMSRGQTWTDIESTVRPAMAAVIFTNNLQVSFLAFAGGVFFGLGTAYVLLSNGLSIGSVLGASQYYGVFPLLGGFVATHGFLEITSILIASGAGLMLGNALLRPGLLRRRDALTVASRRAVELVLGAAPVFILAGLLEAFVSPSEAPTPVKVVLGAGLGLALLAFLLLAGRDRGQPWHAGGRFVRFCRRAGRMLGLSRS